MILLTLSRGKGEETVRLQLPASPAEIGEAFASLDRISLDTTATAILDVSSNVPVLYRCLYDVDAQRVKQLSADEIYRHSAETAAKESLLSALIHDSYELDDDDLDLILKPKNPVEALYQFLTSDKTDLSSESSISSILSEYNAQCQERDLTLGEEVTMC